MFFSVLAITVRSDAISVARSSGGLSANLAKIFRYLAKPHRYLKFFMKFRYFWSFRKG
jgi:hypothetical protein